MDTKTEFLKNAIDEVQQTNRFLDAKAGVLIALESREARFYTVFMALSKKGYE